MTVEQLNEQITLFMEGRKTAKTEEEIQYYDEIIEDYRILWMNARAWRTANQDRLPESQQKKEV